jgi:uncharacterized membrane protein
MESTTTWYYAESGQQRGPISTEEFQRLTAAGTIAPETLVWRQGMGAWQPWKEVQASLAQQPGSVPPPPKDLMAPSAAEGTGMGAARDESDAAGVICAECGRRFPHDETVEFGQRHICNGCKPVLLQRLGEGAPLPNAGTRYISESEFLARDYQIQLSNSLEQAGTTFRREAMMLIAAPILIFGIFFVIGLLGIIPLYGSIIQSIIQMVILGPLFGGLYRMILAAVRGQSVDFSQAFSGFGPQFRELLIAGAIPQVVSFVAFFPFILAPFLMGTGNVRFGQPPIFPSPETLGPWFFVFLIWLGLGTVAMLYTTCSWMYALPLVADKNYKGWDALRLSWKIVHRHWFKNFLVMLCWWLISFAGVLACCVGLVVSIPFALTTFSGVYLGIFEPLEPRASTS